MAREKSVTPRARIASCQRGSARTSSSISTISAPPTYGGKHPGTARQEVTAPPVSETTPS